MAQWSAAFTKFSFVAVAMKQWTRTQLGKHSSLIYRAAEEEEQRREEQEERIDVSLKWSGESVRKITKVTENKQSHFGKISEKFGNVWQKSPKILNLERCKGV